MNDLPLTSTRRPRPSPTTPTRWNVDDNCYPPLVYLGPRMNPTRQYSTLTVLEQELADLLEQFVGSEDSPCHFDHNGDCQEHYGTFVPDDGPPECVTARARRVLIKMCGADLEETVGDD